MATTANSKYGFELTSSEVLDHLGKALLEPIVP